MHRENAFLGHQVVHDGEYGLLDLAGILAACDHNSLLLVVHDDGSFGTGAVDLGHALEARAGDDDEIFAEVLELLRRRTAQQLVDEQVFAGQLGDHAERLLMLRVRAGEAVEHEHVFILQIRDRLRIDRVRLLLADRHVDAAPGDLVVYALAIHDELIFGGASGIFSGLDDQRAGIAQKTFASRQSSFREFCRRQVAVNSFCINDAHCSQGSFDIHILIPP